MTYDLLDEYYACQVFPIFFLQLGRPLRSWYIVQ